MLRHKAVIGMACAAALSALLAAIWFFDPSEGSFPFPRCPFKWLTGWDCPGCGSTRALHSLLHGRIGEALEFNAALVAGVPLAVAALVADRTGGPRLRRALLSPAAVAAVLALAIGWTLFRNLILN